MHGTLASVKPDWFPDWRGECVAIVASGPSTTKAVVESLRDRIHVVAIKKNVELCPWADVVYGCDAAWWKSVRGLPDFRGLKISWVGDAGGPPPNIPGIHKIEIAKTTDRLLFDRPGSVGSGGNSSFQALNLVAQFGATGILAVGFDMHGRSGPHWYGRNTWPQANNPSEQNYHRWRKSFEGVAGDLCAMGVEVINVSAISALTCFKHKTVDQALADWGL